MLAIPQCFKRNCKHYIGVEGEREDMSDHKVVCKAFPKGIPRVIAYGTNLHKRPYPGDHGIQFEEKK